ncbi:MAG: hypothetical protein ACRDP4_05255, partial [Nocardioidaceae bacterium]
EEIGFGNVTGVALLLLGWVPAVLVGDARLTWWLPVAIITAFVLVPSLRRCWWPSRDHHAMTPRRWHVATAGVCIAAVGRLFVDTLRKHPLPGVSDTHIHPDYWFQQTLVNQLQHTLVVHDPQVAGVPKRYHWFSNADVAATSQMSGVPSTTVLAHLWLIVMTVTMVLAAAALARRLMDDHDGEHTWWVGPLAAFLVAAVPVTVVLGEPRLRNLGNGFVSVSTSGILGLVVMLALSGPAIDLLRRRAGPGTWPLMILLMVLAVGAKPSDLPIAACAFALVLVIDLVRSRRVFWSPLVLSAVAVALVAGSAFKLMGGAAGSRVVPLQTLGLDPAVQVAVADGDRWHIGAVGLGVFGLYLVTELPRLLGMLGIAYRYTRADPAVWWAAGVVFAGWCASWLVSQPGFSQQYFWRVVIVHATVVGIVVAVRVVPDVGRPRDVAAPLTTVVVAGLAVGLAVLWWWPRVDTADPGTGAFVRLLPYALAGVVIAALVGMWRLLPRLRRVGPRLPVLTVVLAFAFAAGVPAAANDLRTPIRLALQGQPIPYSSREAPRLVTVEEQRAALWLRHHAAGHGRVVTNVMCVPTRYERGCQATGFWVGALSGLPVVMGGWAYTEKGRDQYPAGSHGPSYKYRPSPYPERERLSLQIVRDPVDQVARELRGKYQARWIFADRRATAVSPAITRYARLRYRNHDVAIYALQPRRSSK